MLMLLFYQEKPSSLSSLLERKKTKMKLLSFFSLICSSFSSEMICMETFQILIWRIDDDDDQSSSRSSDILIFTSLVDLHQFSPQTSFFLFTHPLEPDPPSIITETVIKPFDFHLQCSSYFSLVQSCVLKNMNNV